MSAAGGSPDAAAVRAAAAAIAGRVERTPCRRSRTLSEITGAEVWLKLENLQFTASFKERGALVKLLSLSPEERRRGVVAVSAGNHAQGLAYQARQLGVPVTIVMPRATPDVKVEHTRGFGAEVLLHGADFEAAAQRARELERERDLVLVHPYDDPQVIAGQGTLALEMLEQVPGLEVLVAPIGGGGLVSGCALAVHGAQPEVEVIGVEAARYPAMRAALRGEPARFGSSTLAEGIAVKKPGRLTLPLVREHVADVLLVEEDAIERAVLLLLEVEKTLAEGAGAVPLAALLEHRARFEGRRVGLVVSGGNIDLMPLASILERGLVRTRRLVRLVVALRDTPGGLADVARILAEADANVIQVVHQRTFTVLPLRTAEVEFVLQTRGEAHAREIFAALAAAGYEASWDEPARPAQPSAQRAEGERSSKG